MNDVPFEIAERMAKALQDILNAVDDEWQPAFSDPWRFDDRDLALIAAAKTAVIDWEEFLTPTATA